MSGDNDLTPDEQKLAAILLARQQGRPPPQTQPAPHPPGSGGRSWLMYVGVALGAAGVVFFAYKLMTAKSPSTVHQAVTAVASEGDRDALMRQMLADARMGKK